MYSLGYVNTDFPKRQKHLDSLELENLGYHYFLCSPKSQKLPEDNSEHFHPTSPLLFSLNPEEGLGFFNSFFPYSFTLFLPPASHGVCKWLRVKYAFKSSKENGFCPLGLCFELGNTNHIIKQTLSINGG